MEPLISVIVPIYKVEAYLRDCVDSILAQTYRNLEVILVDDGSPDGCGAICDEYAEKDARITVLHKPNGGLSDARNAGMAVCRGEYLMFVDSDDWLTEDSVSILYDLICQTGAELAIGGRERVEDGSGAVLHSEFDGTETVLTMNRVEAMRDMLQNGCASWARLYRREIHIDVLFPVGEINEDEAIVMRILERCSKVVKTNRIVYRYRCRAESITTAEFSAKKLAWFRHCEENLAYVQENHPELELDAAARLRGCILWSLTEIALSKTDFSGAVKELMGALRKNREIFNQKEFAYLSERIRFFVLKQFGFPCYKVLCNAIRSIR